MSWIRIQSSNGVRYVAPSFAQPPVLEGFDQLFGYPQELRLLRAYPLAACSDAATSNSTMYRRGEETLVMLEQVDLGGRLGLVSIVVGATNTTEQALRVLLSCALTALKSSNDEGVASVLDALCTLQPVPRRLDAALIENDGLKTITAKSEESGTVGWRNRQYLQCLLPAATSSNEIVAALSENEALMGADSNTYGSGCFSEADALRRSSLLYFVQQDAVPISVLFCTVAARTGDKEEQEALKVATASGKSKRSSPAHGTTTKPEATPPCKREFACHSPLGSHPFMKEPGSSSSYWHAIAECASECNTQLLAVLQRSLVECFPDQCPLLTHTMWTQLSPDTQLSKAIRATPVAAAFSASGLLFASPLFLSALSHRIQHFIAAVAVDRLVRPHARTPPQVSARMAKESGCGCIRLHKFPLLCDVGVSNDDAAALDFCFVTVGDAVTMVVGFPFGLRQHTMASTFMSFLQAQGAHTTEDGQPLQQGMESNSGESMYQREPLCHLTFLCTHTTKPPCTRFFDSLFVLDAVDALIMPRRSTAALLLPSDVPFSSVSGKVADKKLSGCFPFCFSRKKKKQRALEEQERQQQQRQQQARVAAEHARIQAIAQQLPFTNPQLQHMDALSGAPSTQTLPHSSQSFPLVVVWLHAACLVARAEHYAFRTLEGSDVAVAFWVHRPPVDPRIGMERKHCLGFFRPLLQLPDAMSCVDATAPIVHDPVVVMDVALETTTANVTSSSASSSLNNATAQVTVMPSEMMERAISTAECSGDVHWDPQVQRARRLVAKKADATSGDNTKLINATDSSSSSTEEEEDDDLYRGLGSDDIESVLTTVIYHNYTQAIVSSQLPVAPLSSSSFSSRIEEVIGLQGDYLSHEGQMLHALKTQSTVTLDSGRGDNDALPVTVRTMVDIKETCEELLMCKRAAHSLFVSLFP